MPQEWIRALPFRLGSAGARVTDVRPPQLVALLHDWSDRFARSYGDDPAGVAE